MTDTLTAEQRSRNMAAIKGKDTKPEMMVRRYLHALGFRYGLHNRKLPGSPDLVFRSLKTVVFIHGCFWHGHENCRYATTPKSNTEFWTQKITRNRERDRESEEKLRAKGWNVITIWECDLRDKNRRKETLEALADRLSELKKSGPSYPDSYDLPMAAEPTPSYDTNKDGNYND